MSRQPHVHGGGEGGGDVPPPVGDGHDVEGARPEAQPDVEPAETVIGPPPFGAAAGLASIGGPGPQDAVQYFGVYELLDEIARGGMGVVYRARQSTLNRIVAVKVILSGRLASDEEVKRFLVEAEAAASLSHPGIVPVYEFGEYSDTHYFSMAYVEGPSLAEKAAGRTLPPAEAVDLMAKVAEAVAHAHDHGVIHRDLKPENILLENGSEPRVTDFGLAKRIDAESDLTQSGTIMGTLSYMAPEQAHGDLGSIGPASDIYALGAILYRLLTGRPPFQAASMFDTIQQVINVEPVPPRRLNPRIPLDLETICLKCLAKEPGQRYQSAVDLRDELRRYQEGRPILARPVGRLAHLWRWCRRNPLPAMLSAGLAIVVLAGVFTASTLWNRAQAEHRRAQDQQNMVGVLTNMVIRKTLDETAEYLDLFFEPVEREVLVARDWGAAGMLDTTRTGDVNQLLRPIIEHYPQVSSLMAADDRGREHMLLCIQQPADDTGALVRKWKCRTTRRDEWGGRVAWLEWDDNVPVPTRSEAVLSDYDPRNRPWYSGAVRRTQARSDDAGTPSGPVHWTDPYVFFTTRDLGITASTTFYEGDGRTHVVALDVLLQDITAYTAGKRPTENGSVLVVSRGQGLIGLPRVSNLKTPEQWKTAFLKQPEELGIPSLTDAMAQLSFAPDATSQVRGYDSQGAKWWVGARPFDLDADHTLWVIVTVPESDLLKGLAGAVGGGGAIDKR